jgi:iron complex outermembrane receptor protein
VTLYDARIGYAEENWGVDLNVDNLFDKAYVSGCQGVNVCAYGEGRTAMLKVHINW